MRRTLTLTVLALLLLPPMAQAASRVTVKGAGFGHGVGLSQYGAYGLAQKGESFDRILRRYYQGTQLSNAPSRPVRVLLQASARSVRFRGATRASGGKELSPSSTYTVRRAGAGQVSLRRGRKRIGTFLSPLRVNRPGHALRLMGRAINGVRSGTYRGSLDLRPGAGGGVTAVNSLGIDPYVRGVVAGEMPSSWDFDALRAQAVAARTYALSTRKSGGVFDQYPDTRSQIYLGVRGETGRSDSAVRDTANRILTYNDEPAVTYFFSSSGGRTENVELSFLGSEPKPWLKSVRDPYDGISPRHRWRLRFSGGSFGARLGARGPFRKIRVLERGKSPRIVRARVYGSRGSRVLTGAQIRARLGLYDSWAYFTSVSSSQVKKPKSSRLARAAISPFPELAGVFDPAPKGHELVVERRERGRWRAVGRVETSANGRYRTTLSRAGVYRVRAGSVTGPAVRVK
jgi:stage II sporulation protein D